MSIGKTGDADAEAAPLVRMGEAANGADQVGGLGEGGAIGDPAPRQIPAECK